MSSPISSRVTPLASARSRCPASWSLRDIAVSAATVTRLRSRFERPGRSQTSPYRTLSLSSMSFGATCRTSLRAADADGGALNGGSFPFGSCVSLRREGERTLTVRHCESGAEHERLARAPARLVLRRLEEILARLDADVVVEDVEAAPALDRAPDHRLALGGVRHVGDECRRLAAFAPDHPDGLLGTLLRLIGAEDLGPLPGEEDGRRLAVPEARTPRAGARHDRDLAGQSSAHEPPTPPASGMRCHSLPYNRAGRRTTTRGDPCTKSTRSSTGSGIRRPASSSTARRRTSRSRSTTTSG